jgi:two-component system alkaline phosphatase synthesis response regulator PhoP
MADIVVLEDEPEILENLVLMLEFAGYEAVGALNGKEGLSLIHKHQPDLIISDIIMPDMTGYEVLQEVKSNKELQDCKFLFVSARTMEEDIERGLNKGADAYITKPFTVEELIKVVQRLLKAQ